jgi:hypothetical protein
MKDLFCKRHGGDRDLTEDEYCGKKEIVIVNRHDKKPPVKGVHRVYVGRPTALGNNWSHLHDTLAQYKVNTREESIERYNEWFATQIYKPTKACDQFITLVEYMMTECYMELECWCAPKACHAETIREAIFDDDWLWK